MLIAFLIVVNIPFFLFIGWLAFDSGDNAASTFYESFTHLLKVLFVPPLLRVMLGWDEDDGLSTLQVAGFLFACMAAVFGEYKAIEHFFPHWIA